MQVKTRSINNIVSNHENEFCMHPIELRFKRHNSYHMLHKRESYYSALYEE